MFKNVVCAIVHDVITSVEVAELLGVSRATVNRRAARGKLPARKLPGAKGQFLFLRKEIDELALQRSIKRHPSSQRAAS